jgi:hypothetical protein
MHTASKRNRGPSLDLVSHKGSEAAMTYSNHPRRTNPRSEHKTGFWLAAALAVLVVVAGIVYATSSRDTQNASAPGATTGAGTTTPSNSPPPNQPTSPSANQ